MPPQRQSQALPTTWLYIQRSIKDRRGSPLFLLPRSDSSFTFYSLFILNPIFVFCFLPFDIHKFSRSLYHSSCVPFLVINMLLQISTLLCLGTAVSSIPTREVEKIAQRQTDTQPASLPQNDPNPSQRAQAIATTRAGYLLWTVHCW